MKLSASYPIMKHSFPLLLFAALGVFLLSSCVDPNYYHTGNTRTSYSTSATFTTLPHGYRTIYVSGIVKVVAVMSPVQNQAAITLIATKLITALANIRISIKNQITKKAIISTTTSIHLTNHHQKKCQKRHFVRT